MYKLFVDKTENFECNLQLEGASLSQSSCRLVVESPDWNLIFYGDISANGDVNIPIKKLKTIMPEGTSGKLRLEVIADEDSYFDAWNDDFKTLVSKKVTVSEIKGADSKVPTKKVSVKLKKKEIKEQSTLSRNIIKETLKIVSKRGVKESNLNEHKSYITELVNEISKMNNLSENDNKLLKTHIYRYLNKK